MNIAPSKNPCAADRLASSGAKKRELSSAELLQVSQTELLESMPGVLYACSPSWVVSSISKNAAEFFRLPPEELIGKPISWDEIIFPDDRPAFREKLVALDMAGSVSWVHRLEDAGGLPIWVAHAIKRAMSSGSETIHGCMVPVHGEKNLRGLDQSIASRFVHKLGNHFQLLNLVISSLRRNLPDSRETDVLQQTVDKTIELTRAFSEYSQTPTWLSVVDLLEILSAAVLSRRTLFSDKGVDLETNVDGAAQNISIEGDPYLLDLAIGHILQNALEATPAGGKVIVAANLERARNRPSVARIRITDTGCGIDEKMLDQVKLPFFSSKKNHDGLGLSLAARFIEMHGGVLRIRSAVAKGTEVEIALATKLAWELTHR